MAASRVLPTVMKKYVVQRLTSKFRDAVELVTVPCPTESDLGPGQLLVRNRFVGINASDINVSAGRYNPTVKPPFDVGFEGVGEVVAVGRGTKRFSPGEMNDGETFATDMSAFRLWRYVNTSDQL